MVAPVVSLARSSLADAGFASWTSQLGQPVRRASYSWLMVGAATATTESGIEEEPGGDDRRFQVLALDGGGVRGIFTAAILAGLEEDVGSPAVEHFDLVVGTSTGGIIALALGAGLTPRQILEFYVEERTAIFAGLPLVTNLRRLFRAKYGPRRARGGAEADLR